VLTPIATIPAVSGLIADATKTSSTTFSNSGIAVAVLSGVQYAIEGLLRFEPGSAADWSFKAKLNGVTTSSYLVQAIATVRDHPEPNPQPARAGLTSGGSGLLVNAVDQGDQIFTIDAGRTDLILHANALTVAFSTGNDGTYTVAGAVRQTSTLVDVYVDEAIPSAVADGDASYICAPAVVTTNAATAIGTTIMATTPFSCTGVDVAIRGLIVPSASGSLAVQFAQNQSSAVSALLKLGSWMRLTRQN
jgi:hypothetical protein